MKPLLTSKDQVVPEFSVLAWDSLISTLVNQENLATISQWWSDLVGKSLRWSIQLDSSRGSVFSYYCTVEKSKFQDGQLQWYWGGTETYCCVPARELILNLKFRELIILPDLASKIEYHVCSERN
jgi:hypothetical protein